MDLQPKAAITVSEMCSSLTMSRSQFYEHVKRGTFHAPLRLPNGRPFFNASQVADNLRAKELSVGVNGEYVLFYRRSEKDPDAPKARSASNQCHEDLTVGLRTLGLNPTAKQVNDAVSTCYPNGLEGVDDSVALRTLFRHLKQPGTA